MRRKNGDGECCSNTHLPMKLSKNASIISGTDARTDLSKDMWGSGAHRELWVEGKLSKSSVGSTVRLKG